MNEITKRSNCTSSKRKHLLSIIMMAEKAGLSTCIVTTARLTHATPATGYAHSAERNWDNDADVKGDCKDIGELKFSDQVYLVILTRFLPLFKNQKFSDEIDGHCIQIS